MNFKNFIRIRELGQGSLYRCTWDGERDPEGLNLACKHCKKVWTRNFAHALRHVKAKHGRDLIQITEERTEQENQEKVEEAENAEISQ